MVCLILESMVTSRDSVSRVLNVCKMKKKPSFF